jgi:hypothetical protein
MVSCILRHLSLVTMFKNYYIKTYRYDYNDDKLYDDTEKKA